MSCTREEVPVERTREAVLAENTVKKDIDFVRAEIKRVTDACIKLYPSIPDFSHGTSMEGFREVRWPGVTVVFNEEKIGKCNALCYSRMEKLNNLQLTKARREPGVAIYIGAERSGEVQISLEDRHNYTKYRLWVSLDFEKLLKYINKNVFYHKSAPIAIVKYERDEKVYAKSFSGFTVKKELTTGFEGPSDDESDEKDDEKIKEVIKEYGKTLASVVFSKWQTI